MIGYFNEIGNEYAITKFELKPPMFNHMWHSKIISDVNHFDGDDAYNTIMKFMPNKSSNPSEYSEAEPYALTNMYYDPDNAKAGETFFSWITSTRGWVYRAVTQYEDKSL